MLPPWQRLRSKMEKAGVAPRIIIDCSHATATRTTPVKAVCRNIAAQLLEEPPFFGVMIESNLVAARKG